MPETKRMSFQNAASTFPETLEKLAKKKKVQNLLVSPQDWAEQFPNVFYVSANVLLCKFDQYVVAGIVDTCKDHLWYQAHVKNNEKHHERTRIPINEQGKK